MYRLAGVLDDICDHFDEAAGRVAREQAQTIRRSAGKLADAVALLKGS
jgi:hypothetical protein